MLCSRMSWSRGGKYDRLGKPGVELGVRSQEGRDVKRSGGEVAVRSQEGREVRRRTIGGVVRQVSQLRAGTVSTCT